MLDVSFDVDTVRVLLHILAVCVWVGGQIVVGALVLAVRRTHPEALGRFSDLTSSPEFGTWCLYRALQQAGMRYLESRCSWWHFPGREPGCINRRIGPRYGVQAPGLLFSPHWQPWCWALRCRADLDNDSMRSHDSLARSRVEM